MWCIKKHCGIPNQLLKTETSVLFIIFHMASGLKTQQFIESMNLKVKFKENKSLFSSSFLYDLMANQNQ